MIRLGNLHIKNVGPFEEQEFDFSIEKGHPDIHIFTGANGTGKTTILHTLANIFNSTKNRFSLNNYNKRFRQTTLEKVAIPNSDKLAIKHPPNYKSFFKININNKKSNQFLVMIRGSCVPNLKYGQFGFEFLSTQINDSNKKKNNNRSIEFTENQFVPYVESSNFETIARFKYEFAAFGYSSYRLINSSDKKHNNEFESNPLHLALEFDKKTDENNNISNWIISRYSKAAIEEIHGNKPLADKYRAALNCLMESIEKLTEGEFTFAIKTNPWQVVTKYHGNEVEFDVLPDGLRSILSWIGDLLMRLDQIPWENKEIPVNEQDIILFLDEIEVHLHPKWQYRILPLTKTIFPNAQIFITTHSPFILNSIDNAKIYQLETGKGISKLKKVSLSNTGDSYQYIYEEILGVNKRFGIETENDIKRFNEIDSEIVQGNNENEEEFKAIIERLTEEGEEVSSLISSKLFRLKRVVGKDYLPA